MRRVVISAALLSLATLVSGVAAGPARADNGGPSGGCSTGTSCEVELQDMVQFNGSYSQGTNNAVVDIAPPPCLWDPIGDATTGSQYIISQFGSDPKKAPTGFGISQSVQQADALLKNPVAGQWYNLPINPAAGAAGEAACLKLPAFYFAQPGAKLPGLNIPPRTLAQLAFAGLNTATLGSITLNPVGTSDVNLPTYVKVAVQPPANGQLGVADGHVYTGVTAYLAGENSVTVWAVSSTLRLSPGTSQADTYQSCGVSGAATGLTIGSRASAYTMAHTAARQPIDCGVTYLAPGTFTLAAAIGWTACWAQTGNAQDPPPAPPYAWCAAHPVPGAGNLQAGTATQQVTAQEIQSVNGG